METGEERMRGQKNKAAMVIHVLLLERPALAKLGDARSSTNARRGRSRGIGAEASPQIHAPGITQSTKVRTQVRGQPADS